MADQQTVTSQETEPGKSTPVDPAELQFLRDRVRLQQNLPFGILAGAAAALIGAAVWAAITYATKFQIGFMAIGVGFLVGFALRKFGRGIDTIYGVMGAVLSLLGCVLGNLLAICAMYAHEAGLPFFQVVTGLDLGTAQRLLSLGFHPMDILFYGIAVYYGYRVSFLTMADIVDTRTESKPVGIDKAFGS